MPYLPSKQNTQYCLLECHLSNISWGHQEAVVFPYAKEISLLGEALFPQFPHPQNNSNNMVQRPGEEKIDECFLLISSKALQI